MQKILINGHTHGTKETGSYLSTCFENDPRTVVVLNKANPELLSLVKTTSFARYVLIMPTTYTQDTKTTLGTSLTIGSLRLYTRYQKIVPKVRFRKICFRILEAIPKPKGFVVLPNIKNYKRLPAGEPYAYSLETNTFLVEPEDFYPLMFNEPQYTDIFGFKGYRDYEIEDKLRITCKEGGPHYFPYAHLGSCCGYQFCVDCGFCVEI
jgi:hypothetical protein